MPLIKVLNYAIRGYRSKAAKGSLNSGISKRLNIIKENHPDIENVEVTEESFDNLEGGIAMLNKRVEKDYRVAEFKKIERKFFKQEAYPNLLTWSEKEQIRFLYNSDPTTWSPEKLSECFPATADIIKKLVKSQWKPMNSQRILHHDNAVKENWKAFENGLLKLPHFLSTHIKNFVSRGKILNLPSEDKSLQTYNPPSASSEFLDIVRNFKEKDNNSRTNECPIVNNPSPYHKEETYVLKQKAPIRLKHKYYTLNQLKKELSHRVSSGSEIVLKKKDNDDAKGIQPKVDSELLPKPLNVLNTTISNKEFKTAVIPEHIEEIPLKITIPKEKIVKDKTHLYKVKDCFYDNNGEFVYRVPGMGN